MPPVKIKQLNTLPKPSPAAAQPPLGASGTRSATGRSVNPIDPATNTLPPISYKPQGSPQAQTPLGAQSQSGSLNPVNNALTNEARRRGYVPGNDPAEYEMTPEQRQAYMTHGTVMDEGMGQNAGQVGTIGTQLSVGGNVRMQDPNNPGKFIRVDATDYLKAQQEKGTPLGMLYGNATDTTREDMLLNAGRDQLNRYNDAAMGAVSGTMGEAAMGAGMDQGAATATVGAANFDQATQAVSAMMNRADSMGSDINNLRAAAAGTVPSAAAIQQRQGISDAIAAQQALAAGARGGNIGLAQQQAAAQGTSTMSRGLADAAALRANEQATARGQLTQAQSAQGAIMGQAANAGTAAGTGRTNASALSADALLRGGSEILGSQFKGMDALGNVSGMEFDRVSAAIAQDQVDQDALQQYIYNLMNAGMGHQINAQRVTNENAQAKRGMVTSLVGAGLGAAGSMGAGALR